MTPHVSLLVAPVISTSASVTRIAKLRLQEVAEAMCSPSHSCMENSYLQTVKVHETVDLLPQGLCKNN